MAVNIYDVAKRAGVSVVTASRVINNHPKVRASNRRKVLDAMEELDYKPNAAARTLSSGKTGMIALVLPDTYDYFWAQIMAGVESALEENGLFMVVTTVSDYHDFTGSKSARLIMEGRVDGLLMVTPVDGDSYLLELKKRGIPVVLLDQQQRDLQLPSVTVDNFTGGFEATMSLIRGGARRVAHIGGGENFTSSGERKAGYLKALEESGLPAEPELIAGGSFTVKCGFEAVSRWLSEGRLPDAVFTADDNIAFGVLDAARTYGLKVPEQLAVIGFDDHPYDNLLHPRLSTVRQPTEKMGEFAVGLLSDVINNRPRRVSRVTLKPEVILRETTINPQK